MKAFFHRDHLLVDRVGGAVVALRPQGVAHVLQGIDLRNQVLMDADLLHRLGAGRLAAVWLCARSVETKHWCDAVFGDGVVLRSLAMGGSRSERLRGGGKTRVYVELPPLLLS